MHKDQEIGKNSNNKQKSKKNKKDYKIERINNNKDATYKQTNKQK